MRVAGTARERDLRTLSAAIGLSALGDGVALVALALQAKNLTGERMGGGIARPTWMSGEVTSIPNFTRSGRPSRSFSSRPLSGRR